MHQPLYPSPSLSLALPRSLSLSPKGLNYFLSVSAFVLLSIRPAVWIAHSCFWLCGGGRLLRSQEERCMRALFKGNVYIIVNVCLVEWVCVCVLSVQGLSLAVCVLITSPRPWGQLCRCLFLDVCGLLLVFPVSVPEVSFNRGRFVFFNSDLLLFFFLFREPMCALVPHLQCEFPSLVSLRFVLTLTLLLNTTTVWHVLWGVQCIMEVFILHCYAFIMPYD